MAACIVSNSSDAFGPATKDFAEAGISLVAISTDTVEGLKKTFAKSKSEDGFPFPLLSDERWRRLRASGRSMTSRTCRCTERS
ncbi:MAG: redoxin domain-containing protein [Verrucomicrobia bacterium]|nr:redoxin domain-containing protein [Verrucomicrobiota bacterium]